mgnify:CR=1 FL=1
MSQVGFDRDYVIKDNKPDVSKVVCQNGQVKVDEIKASGENIWLSGSIEFEVLYTASDRELSRIDNPNRKLIKPGIHTNRILLADSLKHKLLLKRYCILYMLHPVSGDIFLQIGRAHV